VITPNKLPDAKKLSNDRGNVRFALRIGRGFAHTIRTWQPIQIPGPLQTPDYSRALHKGAGTPDALIDERVATRIDLQQQTLERKPVPVTLLAVMDEAVLYRVVASIMMTAAASPRTPSAVPGPPPIDDRRYPVDSDVWPRP
jgi:hypothetical protein